MKNVRLLITLLITGTILASCGVSQNGFGGSSIQKRKYTKGFYLSHNKSNKSTDNKSVVVEEEKLVEMNEAPISDVKSTLIQENGEVKQSVLVEETAAQVVTENRTKKLVRKNKVTEKSPLESPKKSKKKDSNNQFFTKEQDKKTQKSNNSGGSSDSMFILAVIFAILIPPIGVLIHTNIDWLKVLICLLLTFLFFLPGMIYALLVVFDVI